MDDVKSCKARRYSDQMVCHACRICWDVNDPEPPQCKQSRVVQHQARAIRNRYKEARQK